MLKSDFKVTPSNPASSKKLSPKLKIHNLKEHRFENMEKLKEAILEKNSDIKHCLESIKDSFFDVLFIAKNQNNISLYSIVKASSDVRNIIQKSGRVFIDMNSHKVTDHFHVNQCFKCQGFGHKAGSKFCPLETSENSVCLYCAGGHISKTCPYKNNADEYKCSNCLKSRIKDYHKHAKGHTSSDMQCPLKTKEIKRIMALTNIDPKN